jgi:hypothetical protein
VRLDATVLLAKTRGAQVDGELAPGQDRSGLWLLRWREDDCEQRRPLALAITTTAQRLGGVRRWWRCPVCRRRCGVLLARAPEAPIGCRVCLQARYATDYPARDRRRRFVALVDGLGEGGFGDDSERELDTLLAPRRRGVRRGRRVAVRAARAMSRLDAQCRVVTDLVKMGGI